MDAIENAQRIIRIDTNILIKYTIKVKKKEMDLWQLNKNWKFCEKKELFLAVLRRTPKAEKKVLKKCISILYKLYNPGAANTAPG